MGIKCASNLFLMSNSLKINISGNNGNKPKMMDPALSNKINGVHFPHSTEEGNYGGCLIRNIIVYKW